MWLGSLHSSRGFESWLCESEAHAELCCLLHCAEVRPLSRGPIQFAHGYVGICDRWSVTGTLISLTIP